MMTNWKPHWKETKEKDREVFNEALDDRCWECERLNCFRCNRVKGFAEWIYRYSDPPTNIIPGPFGKPSPFALLLPLFFLPFTLRLPSSLSLYQLFIHPISSPFPLQLFFTVRMFKRYASAFQLVSFYLFFIFSPLFPLISPRDHVPSPRSLSILLNQLHRVLLTCLPSL